MRFSREKACRILASPRTLAAVLVLAFVLRAAWGVAAGDQQRFWDSDSYITIADNYLAGEGLVWGDSVAGRPPLYPLLVAATRFEIFGRRFLPLYLAQAALGTLSVWLFASAAGRLFSREAAGATAMVLAVYPFHVFYTATVLSETLFIFLLAAVFRMAVGLSLRPTVWVAAAAGAVAGAAFLARPSVLALLALYAAVIAVRPAQRRKAVVAAAVFLLIVACTVVGWGARNHALTGRWVFTTTGVGASLYDGVGPQADGSSQMSFLNEMEELSRLSEVERDDYLKARSLEAIKADPGRIAGLAVVKAWRFWTPVPTNERFRAPLYMIVSLLAVAPVYLGAAVALLRRRVGLGWGDLIFLAAAPAYFTLLHMIFVGSTRYRAPVMPFIVIIATMGALSFLAGPGPRAKR